MKKRKRAKRKVIKSAATGRFVSKKYAKRHPRSTFAETVRKSQPPLGAYDVSCHPRG